MTATDELHRLLDERGVEYKDRNVFGKHVFHWGKPFHGAMFTDAGEWTELVVENASPEQAVDATLGRGTCEVVSSIRHDYEGGYGGTEYEHELSCGHKTWWADDDPPEWCPYCGRKVIG